jgi:hypothetical protein
MRARICSGSHLYEVSAGQRSGSPVYLSEEEGAPLSLL